MKDIGNTLERLGRRRNDASYDLLILGSFASDVLAHKCIRQGADALALLDAIEADPARLAAAIASLPPPSP
jgi:hypothetical protein